MNEETKTAFFPNIKQTFLMLLVILAISIPVSIPFGIIGFITKEYSSFDKDLIESAANLFTYLTLFIISSIIYLKKFRRENKTNYLLKLNKNGLYLLPIMIIGFFASIYIIDPLSLLIPMPASVQEFFSKMMKPNIFTFLMLVIAAPILEEIIFRGIILEGFLKNYSPQKAIIWSALMFGFFHLNPWQAIGASIAGIIIGWLYWKTNSLIPGMILHAINNLFGFLITNYSPVKADTFFQLINNWYIFGTFFIISIFLFYFTYKYLDKNLEVKVIEDII